MELPTSDLLSWDQKELGNAQGTRYSLLYKVFPESEIVYEVVMDQSGEDLQIYRNGFKDLPDFNPELL